MKEKIPIMSLIKHFLIIFSTNTLIACYIKLSFCGRFMLTSSELIQAIQKYDPNLNVDLVRKAYIFSMEAHGMQKRASGSPYFYHPAEVARILTEQLHMDYTTVIVGLLHDVLEDTNVGFEELEEIFGSEIAFLVEGVTKLSHIKYTSSQVKQSESYQKFIIAVTHDIRVLIVKLADRLQNMRTLSYIKSEEKRRRIAIETLDLYAPLAERIGMNGIKDEIADIAFFTLHPNEYRAISTKLEHIRNQDNNFVQNTILELQKVLSKDEIPCSINGREKTPYSIWKKMQKRNIGLDQIYDIIAFRIIVQSVKECYAALGVVHTNFRIIPGRFKDYISIPKLNNYRSLHTTVIGTGNQPIEIQIRTEDMHRMAEEGIAAHWSYKNGDLIGKVGETQNYAWLKRLIAIIKNSPDPYEVLDNSKLEMFDDEVFCFTSKGDLITLPKGATGVDFAYEIHTDLGNTCIGVRINGKLVPLKTVLKNGDRVDIITSPYQHPEATWEDFVVTGKARSCIRKFVKSQEKGEFISLGFQLSRYIFAEMNIQFSEDLILYEKFCCDSLTKFYYNMGKGLIPLKLFRSTLLNIEGNNITFNDTSICLIDFIPDIAVHFSKCCCPILGDKIIGILQANKGLIIHQTTCRSMEESCEAFIRVKWNQDDNIETSFMARLQIIMLNHKDSFAAITNIISSNNANISNLKIEHRTTEFFSLLVDISVTDIAHLGEIQAALRACSKVKSVKRL